MGDEIEGHDRSKEPPCKFDCIFGQNGQLYGDCRVPWSDECRLNMRDKRKHDDDQDRDTSR